MKLDLTNHQPHPLDLEKVKTLTLWLMQSVQQLEPSKKWGELSLVLLDDKGMTPINHTYFGKNQPTDVISFTYDETPADRSEGPSGEVMVNVDRAVQEGPERESASHELALYIAHGCHHLTDASDETPELKASMLATETAWLTLATKEGLLSDLFIERTPDTK